MSERPNGYQCYWRRMARHMRLSDAAKQLGGGIRASQLSAFERDRPHELTDEQIDAYIALLFAEEPEIPADDATETA